MISTSCYLSVALLGPGRPTLCAGNPETRRDGMNSNIQFAMSQAAGALSTIQILCAYSAGLDAILGGRTHRALLKFVGLLNVTTPWTPPVIPIRTIRGCHTDDAYLFDACLLRSPVPARCLVSARAFIEASRRHSTTVFFSPSAVWQFNPAQWSPPLSPQALTTSGRPRAYPLIMSCALLSDRVEA